MSNWSITAATRTETLGATTGEGTTVTANATTHVKGSYSTIGTAGFAYGGFFLCFVPAGGAKYRIDVAVNSGGSDQIIIPDLLLDATSAGGNIANSTIFFPIHVPAGAVVKARSQSATSGGTVRLLLVGFATDFPGYRRASRVVALSAFTNTDPTATVTLAGTSFTSWTEVTSSTADRICGLYVSSATGGDTTRTGGRILAEIGTGSAGAEVARMSWQGAQVSGSLINHIAGPLPVDIVAGSRLAYRAQASSASTDTFGLAFFGLVP